MRRQPQTIAWPKFTMRRPRGQIIALARPPGSLKHSANIEGMSRVRLIARKTQQAHISSYVGVEVFTYMGILHTNPGSKCLS